MSEENTNGTEDIKVSDDLKKKAEELVVTVYDYAVESNSIDDVDLEQDVTAALDKIEAQLDAISSQVTEVKRVYDELTAPDQLNSTTVQIPEPDAENFKQKVKTLATLTDTLDLQIAKMPKPRNKIRKPKYYKRVHKLHGLIEELEPKINSLQNPFEQQPLIGDSNEDKKNGTTKKIDKADDAVKVRA